MHLGFSGFVPTISLGTELNLNKTAKIKMGLWGGTLLGGTSSEDGGDTFVLPFVALNFRF